MMWSRVKIHWNSITCSFILSVIVCSATLVQPGTALAISYQIQPTTLDFSATGRDGNKITFGGGAKDGSYSYSLPIEVPPGRHDFQPALSLQYRSTGAVHGTIAQGWTLPLPSIAVDTSSSQLGREHAPVYLGLNGERLVPVADHASGAKVYRAKHDSSHALYIRGRSNDEFEWEVKFPDGSTTVFGQKSSSKFIAEDAQTHLIAPIWKQIDRWGNRIEYDFIWSRVAGATARHVNVTGGAYASGSLNPPSAIERLPAFEYQLQEVRYGMSAGGGQSVQQAVAKVVLSWDEQGQAGCEEPDLEDDAIKTPVGASYSYRSGALIVSGAHQLDRITTFALRPDDDPNTSLVTMREVREYELQYDEQTKRCLSISGAPRRLLSSVRERGYHLDGTPGTWLEPTQFTYGKHYDVRWETHEIRPAGESVYELEHAFTNEAGGRQSMARPEWSTAFKVGGGIGVGARVPLPYDNERTRLLDIDSDGRADLVKATVDVVANSSGPPSARCAAQWFRNTGTGFSNTPSGTIALPSIPWMNSSTNSYGFISGGEFCGLNVQASGLLNTEMPDYDDGFSCTDKDADSGRVLPTWQTTKALVHYVWEDHDHDGDLDLLVGVNHAPTLSDDYPFFARDDRFRINYNVYTDTSSDLGEFPTYIETALDLGDNVPSDEDDPYYNGPSSRQDLHRNEICEVMPDFQGGGYPWLVFKNDGRGQFSSRPDVKRMPVPLVMPKIPVTWMEDLVYSSGLGDWLSATTQSLQSAGTGTPGSPDYQVSLSSNIPSLLINRVDINGDGYPDLVESSVKKLSRNSRQWIMGRNDTGEPYDVVHDWRVLLGTSEGGFQAAPDNKAYVVYTPGLRDGGFYSALRVTVPPMSLGGETTGFYAVNNVPVLDDIAHYFNTRIKPHDAEHEPMIVGPVDCETVSPASEVDYSAVDTWIDLNGDGLSDKVQSANGCSTPVSIASSWNRGDINGLESPNNGPNPAHVQTLNGRGMLSEINADNDFTGAHPGRMMDVYRHPSSEVIVNGKSINGAILDPYSSLWFIAAVKHGRRINLVDVDQDGLPDQVIGKDVRYNHSGQHFGAQRQGVFSNQIYPALARSSTLKPHIPFNPVHPGYGEEFEHYAMRESVNGIYMDFDGNGLTDYIYKNNDNIHSPQMVRLIKQKNNGLAPWLLNEIKSPTGAITSIEYANARNDEEIVSGALRKRVGPPFVVKSVTVDPWSKPGITVPAMTERYGYSDPVFNFDHEGRHKFAGYSRVFTINEDNDSNASIFEKIWSFDQWHTGLLSEERLRDQNGFYHTISRFTYQAISSLANEDFTVFVPDTSHEYRCHTQQAYNTCLNEGTHTARQSVYQGFGSLAGSSPLLVTHTETREFDQNYLAPAMPASEHGNRREVQQYHLHFSLNGGYYLLVPTVATHHVVEVDKDNCNADSCNATEHLVGEVRLDYDAAYLAPISQSQRINADDQRAVTEYRYTSTGQILQTRTPGQTALGSGGRWKRFHYDDYQMYPRISYNELNHQRRIRTWDYGYGTALLTEGAAYKCNDYNSSNTVGLCDDNPSVTSDANRRYRPAKVVLDDLGRVVEEWAGFDHPSVENQYKLVKVAETTYNDFNRFSHKLNAYTTRSLLDSESWPADGLTGLSTFTYSVDGVGRKLKEQHRNSDYSNSSGNDTFYQYDKLGRMIGIRTMNPAHQKVSRTQPIPLYVQYTATYDIFNRLIATRIPELHTGSSGSTGIDTIYHSPLKIELRETDTTHGPSAVKLQHYDRFGKLISLEERKDSTTGMVTTANYEYDARGALVSIKTDEGVVTTISRDWLARPVAVSRADKTWRYTYDNNSNITAIHFPQPEGASEPDYTSSARYDALNRIKRRTPARGAINSLQRQTWLTGPIIFHYDEDSNALGQQNRVTSDLYEIRQSLDAMGRVTEQTQILKVEGFNTQPLTVENSYRGTRLVHSAEADKKTVNGHTDRTHLYYEYDGAGLLQSVRSSSGNAQNGFVEHNLAEVKRNAANRVIQRRSAYALPDDEFDHAPVQVFWNHDTQGKITDINAYTYDSSADSLTRRSALSVGYYHHGDPSSMYHLVDGEAIEFSYYYDDRHMLERVHTGEDGPYQSWYSYTNGGRLASARVNLAADAVTGYTRDVEYVYDELDPSQLRLLQQQDGSGEFARYDYDAAGNMIERIVPGQSHHQFFYDSDNRLREVLQTDSGQLERFFYHGADRVLAIRFDSDGKRMSSRRWFGNTELRYNSSNVVETTLTRVELEGTVARIKNRQKVDYQIHSPQNHMLLAVDEQGHIRGGGTYGPFGEVLRSFGDIDDYTRGFNNKDYSRSNDLYYYGHRYFDPVAMIWNRPDPKYSTPHPPTKSNPLDANLYTFSRNNPISFIDPDGLEIFLVYFGNDKNIGLAIDIVGAAATAQQLAGFLDAGRALGVFGTAFTFGFTVGGAADKVFGISDGISDAMVRDDLLDQYNANQEEIHYAQQYTQLVYAAAKLQGENVFGKRPLYIRIPPGIHKQIEKAAARYRKLRKRCSTQECRVQAWKKSFKNIDLDKVNIEIDEYEDAKEQQILQQLQAQEEEKITDQSMISVAAEEPEDDFPNDPVGAALDEADDY